MRGVSSVCSLEEIEMERNVASSLGQASLANCRCHRCLVQLEHNAAQCCPRDSSIIIRAAFGVSLTDVYVPSLGSVRAYRADGTRLLVFDRLCLWCLAWPQRISSGVVARSDLASDGDVSTDASGRLVAKTYGGTTASPWHCRERR